MIDFWLKRWRKTFAFAIYLLAILVALILVISIAGIFPMTHWQVDLLCNLRPHFMLSGLISGLIGLKFRKNLVLGLSILIFGINFWFLGPFFLSPGIDVSSKPAMTVIHLNTNLGKADLSTLNRFSADLLLLQEVTPQLDQKLNGLFPSYDIVHSHPLTNTHGSAVLRKKDSPIVLHRSEIVHCPENSKRPLIVASFEVGDRIVQVMSLHLTRPLNVRTNRYQKIELDAVAEWSQKILQNENEELLVIGDFNATPWSNRFYRLLSRAKLQDSLPGYGLQNTWPTNVPLLLGLPIDHAVHSDGLVSTQRSTAVIKGTDHTLLQVELAMQDA